jgi:hypothetical protein
MARRDWLPSRETDLVDLVKVWIEWLSDGEKRTNFGWNTEECSVTILKIGDFQSARDNFVSADTTGNRILKDAAKKIMETYMRNFANTSVRFNKKMTQADKLALGIVPRDIHHTPTPDPVESVNFEFKSNPNAHRIIAPYSIADATSRGKGHYHGVEVRFWVLPLTDPAPQSAKHPGWCSEVNTATPWEHTFEENEIGKRLYMMMRWENGSVGRDQATGRGPWSSIQNVVIA